MTTTQQQQQTDDSWESPDSVVVYNVTYLEGRTEISSVGRDTLAVATEFCRSPKWPYNRTDSFVAVDDWGYGKIVAATPDLETHIGTNWFEFKARAH